MHLPAQFPAVAPPPSLEAQPERIEILAAFADLPDVHKASGKQHHMAFCLELFTLAVAVGNRGFLAIGDWLKCYRSNLIALFNPPKGRLPFYSTIRRVLLKLDYGQYSAALAQFFCIEPLAGETLARALSALLLQCRYVLQLPLDEWIDVIRARPSRKLLTVLTPEDG